MNLTDALGTAGVTILLLAFLLNILKSINRESKIYLLMNLVGAILACYASVLLAYWPFIILEGCWALVSLMGLIKTKK